MAQAIRKCKGYVLVEEGPDFIDIVRATTSKQEAKRWEGPGNPNSGSYRGYYEVVINIQFTN